LGDGRLTFALTKLEPHARPEFLPVVEPLETRRPDMGRQASAIRVRLSARTNQGDWSESHWLTYSNFPDADNSPLTVHVPGQAIPYELTFTRQPHKLGTPLAARKLSVDYFPGRQSVTAWTSDFYMENEDGDAVPMIVKTNATASVGPWTLFQSS